MAGRSCPVCPSRVSAPAHGQPGDETGRQYNNWGLSAKQGGDLRLATPSPVLAANELYGFTPSLFNHLRSRPLAL